MDTYKDRLNEIAQKREKFWNEYDILENKRDEIDIDEENGWERFLELDKQMREIRKELRRLDDELEQLNDDVFNATCDKILETLRSK